VLTRVTLDLTDLRYDSGIPETLDLFLALTEDGNGAIGSTLAGDVWIASLAPVRWTKERQEFRIEKGRLDLWADAFFTWDAIVLTLDDFATGTGRVEQGWVEVLWGDVVSSTLDLFDTAVTAAPEDDDPVLDVWPYIGIDTPFVGDAFTVYSSEPVAAAEFASRVRLLADGETVDARVDPTDRVGVYATRVTISPRDYLPFESELTLAIDGLEDPVGRLATWDGRAWSTMADPGPASENPGFERADPQWGYGWYGAPVRPRLDPDTWPILDHEARLDTYEYDRMLGYFDVPADAEFFEFSAAVDGGCMSEYCLSGVRVYFLTPGERREVYVPTFTPAPLEYYDDCYSNVFSIPEERIRINISELAGKRVFVYARAFWDWPCDRYFLWLDDFAVLTAAAAGENVQRCSEKTAGVPGTARVVR